MTEQTKTNSKKEKVKTTLLSKLTVRDMGGSKSAILERVMKKKGTEVPICHIFGHASKFTAEQSSMGQYILFTGNFKGKSLINGRMYRSGRLILAGPAESVLQGELDGRMEEGAIIAFGITLTARFDEKAATSYIFGAQPFVENEEDPLNALEKLLPA